MDIENQQLKEDLDKAVENAMQHAEEANIHARALDLVQKENQIVRVKRILLGLMSVK